MPLIHHLFRGLRDLVTTWYAVDRVRIAPTTGRLLHLRVGDSIVLLDDVYSVRGRRVQGSSAGHQLTYVLETSVGNAELRVSQNVSAHDVCGELVIGDNRRIVFDDDVVVLTVESSSSTDFAAALPR